MHLLVEQANEGSNPFVFVWILQNINKQWQSKLKAFLHISKKNLNYSFTSASQLFPVDPDLLLII